MRVRTRRDEKVIAELTKLSNSNKVQDIRIINMEEIERTLKNGKIMNTSKRR